MSRIMTTLALIAVLSSIGGCAIELTGGAENGEARTVMTDDPGSSGPGSSRIALSRMGAAESEDPATPVVGTVESDLAASLVRENGGVVDLTEGSARGKVAIGVAARSELGRTDVPEGNYPTVRLTFTRVEAHVESGLGVGGISAEGTVAVDLGGEALVVEVPLSVRVHEDELTTIVIDLNSHEWLSLADPTTHLVSRAAFRQAIAVRVE